MQLTIWKDNAEFEETSLPKSLVLSWNTAFPDLKVEDALGIALWLSIESEWVVTAPLLSELIVNSSSSEVVLATDYGRLTSPPGGGFGKEPW